VFRNRLSSTSFAKWYCPCYGRSIASSRINSGFVARVWLFGLATVAVSVFIAFETFSVWRHVAVLRTSINKTQSQSFNIANRFQRVFLDLNSRMLQYEINSKPEHWEGFFQQWTGLNEWIDEQKVNLTSKAEQAVFSEIDNAFDLYLAAAQKLHNIPKVNNAHPLVEFAKFQEESDRIIELGYKLAVAHEGTLQAFYSETSRSIRHLQSLLIAALALLILLSAGLWAVIYRDMIAPLQAKLVESRALLERQEKLASLGVLSAGLAHEIRNPLTAMKARLFTLGKRLEPGTAQEQDAGVISREVDRLERILKDFLEFARPSTPKLNSVQALSFLREVRALLLPQLELQNIQIVLEETVNPTINIDSHQMTQVMLNLVRNAAESIGRNGVITLRVREESVLLNGRQSDVAVLEVTDTGKGISPEVEKRLFDPFHTTKDGGTGLGLSIAGRIVERHAGALRYRTRLGHGTTFGVVLPRVRSHEPAR
jgi:signal transduction histidine kinase